MLFPKNCEKMFSIWNCPTKGKLSVPCYYFAKRNHGWDKALMRMNDRNDK